MPDKDKISELAKKLLHDGFYDEALKRLPEHTQQFVESTSWAGEAHEQEVIKIFVAKITQLLLEERKKGAIEYNAKLNEQDPYEPLPGTPREYASMKLEEYLRELEATLKEELE